MLDSIAKRYKKLPHELMELELDQFLFNLFVFQRVQDQEEKDYKMDLAQRDLDRMERGG